MTGPHSIASLDSSATAAACPPSIPSSPRSKKPGNPPALPKLRLATAIATTLIAGWTASAAGAQDRGEEEKKRPWSNTADFSLVLTSGNSENTSIALSDQFTYDWRISQLTFKLAALGTRTRSRDLSNVDGVVVVSENERTTAQAYSASGRYRHSIGSGLLIFTGGMWQSDRFAGVENRFTGSLGLGYMVLDSEKEALLLEFGGDVSSEEQPSGRKTFPGGRADMTYRRSLGSTSRFDLNLEILPNLQDLDDLRSNVELALTSTLVEKLALKLTYVFLFDNRPATVLVESSTPGVPDAVFEFDKIDTRTAASVVVNF